MDHEVVRLNRAKVDNQGMVTLADGTVLFAVEVSRAPETIDPSELDCRILHAALQVIDGGKDCYRSLREGVVNADPDMVPDLRFLDCDSIGRLRPPPLKDIVAGIKRVDRKLKASDQKIADALRKFGLLNAAPGLKYKAALSVALWGGIARLRSGGAKGLRHRQQADGHSRRAGHSTLDRAHRMIATTHSN